MSTNAKPIKAITILEPWATLIALGAKQYETRSWMTDYRGPLVIHAGKNPGYLADALTHRRFRDVLRPAGYNFDRFRFGCALCVVDLVDCRHTEVVRQSIDLQELDFGDFDNGRYAWKLANVRPFAEPVPWRGAQGLWTWAGPLPEGVTS